jgi:hypothetical protein
MAQQPEFKFAIIKAYFDNGCSPILTKRALRHTVWAKEAATLHRPQILIHIHGAYWAEEYIAHMFTCNIMIYPRGHWPDEDLFSYSMEGSTCTSAIQYIRPRDEADMDYTNLSSLKKKYFPEFS